MQWEKDRNFSPQICCGIWNASALEWNASALVHFHYNLLSTSQFVWQMKICTKNAWTMPLVYLESKAQSDIVLLHFAFLSFTFSKISSFLFLNLNGKESIPDFHCGLILLSLICLKQSHVLFISNLKVYCGRKVDIKIH